MTKGLDDVQTFMPHPDFDESAACLDRLRLGKQRVENVQIMRALLDPTYGWQSHPAVNMWRGHELGLMDYQRAICLEWVMRGYKDTCWEKLTSMWIDAGRPGRDKPSWVGLRAFHLSHQSALVRKYPDYYKPLFPGVSDDLEYVWPMPGVDYSVG